jgi:hypothetical protein
MLTINTAALVTANQMLATGDDIRFGTTCSGSTLLSYWIEGPMNNAATKIWVKIPSLPASGTTSIYMFYGNPTAAAASSLTAFNGPFSSTNQITGGNVTSTSGNSQRGFRFSPNTDILVTQLGKYEPSGTTRYVTLFNFATQAIIIQGQVSGPATTYSYSNLTTPLWLTSGTQYLLELFQGPTDAYYYQTSSQVNTNLTFYDMRYCNSCTQNTFPTTSLANLQYGYPDMTFYTRNTLTPAPTYTPGAAGGGPPPPPPGPISGATLVCPGSSQTYSVVPVTGATSYTWTLPSGWTGTSTTNSITVTPGATGGNVSVTAGSGCASSTAQVLAVTTLPSPPNTITPAGPTTFCQGQSLVLNAPVAAGNTYQWKLNGSNITGATSASYSASAAGAYTVTVFDGTCSSTSAATTITLNPLPTQPGAITGSTSMCPQSAQTYSIAPVTNSTSYVWTLPAGWIGTSTTTSIAVTTGSTGTISVASVNGCGTSSAQTLAVTALPAPNPTITAGGPTIFCQGGSVILSTPTGTGYTYQWQQNASNISGATNSTYTATTSAFYTVVVSNGGCSVTSPVTPVSANPPTVQPGPISGNASPCAGVSETYSVPTLTGATSYTWTLPGGWTGTSTTNVITVTTGSTGGTMSVAGVNICGTGAVDTAALVVTPGPVVNVTTVGSTTFCQGGSVQLKAGIGSGLAYQWHLNGSPISGATNYNYVANASGLYTVVVTPSGGCPTTSAPTTVTVNPIPTPVVSVAGNTLSTPGGQGTYQWYLNNFPITGAVSNTYVANQAGTYHVVVTSNGCTGKSNVVAHTMVGIADISLSDLKLYPNPNTGSFTIELPVGSKPDKVRLLNVHGQLVKDAIVKQVSNSILVTMNEAAGMYFVELVFGDNILRKKVTVEPKQ